MLFIVHQEILDASIYQFQRVCFHLSGSSLEAEREFQANLAMKGWSQKENLKTNQVFEEQWTQHIVGTIARARFNTQGVVAGTIVGTGTNAAYVQSAHATYVQSAHAISIGLSL